MEYGLWINGEWLTSEGHKVFNVYNPATENIIAEVAEASLADVNQAVKSAKQAFQDGRWSRLSFGDRAARLMRFADLLEQKQDEFVRWESLQTGKPVKLVTYSDFPFSIDNLRFFAGASRVLEGHAAGEYDGSHTSWIRREPIGVVASIAPWNYPFLMGMWKIGPALASGNTVVLKPASLTPITALMMGPLAKEAGIPDGVLNIVAGPGRVIGNELVNHHDVAMVSLTGDTQTGRAIMASAAARVKRLHLELGGKAPAVVLDDADLPSAVQGIAVGSLVNTGQDCTAATRVYVHRSIYRDFVEQLKSVFQTVRLGDPLDMHTDIGPVISQAQWTKVDGYVQEARKMGAEIEIGGTRPASMNRGYYYEPTLITSVEQHWPCVQEEIFGPVLVVLPFQDDAEALAMANDVDYGLASSIWTRHLNRGLRFARDLNFGEVWMNDHLPLTSEMPHGGIKQSGFGHDLSRYALEEYTTLKHVMAETEGGTVKPWHFTVLGDTPES